MSTSSDSGDKTRRPALNLDSALLEQGPRNHASTSTSTKPSGSYPTSVAYGGTTTYIDSDSRVDVSEESFDIRPNTADDESTQVGSARLSHVVSPTEASLSIETNSVLPQVHSQATRQRQEENKKRSAPNAFGDPKRARPTHGEDRANESNVRGVVNGGVTDAERASAEDFLRRLKLVVWKWQNENMAGSRPLLEGASAQAIPEAKIVGTMNDDGNVSNVTDKTSNGEVEATNKTEDPIAKHHGYVNRCVPLARTDFAGNSMLQPTGTTENTMTVPRLHLLANYPNFMDGSTTHDGKRHCVMCGQLRPCATINNNKTNGEPFIFNQHGIRICSACSDRAGFWWGAT